MTTPSQPLFTIRQLLEAGVHYGHHIRRWNPKMQPYIFGTHHNTHIIDLQKTAVMLHRALEAVRETASKGGRILFVGTRRQASALVADAARQCGQYYVNHRWLGGMLTNWKTVSQSIRRMKDLEKRIETVSAVLEKKEILELTRDHGRLEKALGGIRDMGGVPDLLFVIDTHREQIAVKEARKLGIPVVGIVDSNADPDGITWPVPGNDDATRALSLYCALMVESVLAGVKDQMASVGVTVREKGRGRRRDGADDATAAVPEAGAAEGVAITPAGEQPVLVHEAAGAGEVHAVHEAQAGQV